MGVLNWLDRISNIIQINWKSKRKFRTEAAKLLSPSLLRILGGLLWLSLSFCPFGPLLIVRLLQRMLALQPLRFGVVMGLVLRLVRR